MSDWTVGQLLMIAAYHGKTPLETLARWVKHSPGEVTIAAAELALIETPGPAPESMRRVHPRYLELARKR